MKVPGILSRSERRQTVFRLLHRFLYHFSWIFYVFGFIGVCLLPFPFMHKKAFFDENALMPGQVLTKFDYSVDFGYMEKLRPQMAELVDMKEEKAKLEKMKEKLKKLGLYVHEQRYAYQKEDGKWINGTNIYGIQKMPKSDGSESILLSAPWDCGNGQHNTNGLTFLLGLIAFHKKQYIWARDFIYFVPGHPLLGTHAFLSMYHNMNNPSENVDFQLISARAGIIHQALNFELPGTSDYSHIGIFIPSVNGQQATADLVNTVIKSAQWDGIPVVLNDRIVSKLSGGESDWDIYQRKANVLTHFMGYQATGTPVYDHAFYARYRIESVTFLGLIKDDSYYKFKLYNLGCAVEAALRSLNNLIERLHHSFWFYWMPDPDNYVMLSFYIGPVALLFLGIVFQSLMLWIDSPSSKSSKPTIHLKGKRYIYLLETEGILPFSRRYRSFRPSIVYWFFAHAFGMILSFFNLPDTKFFVLFGVCAILSIIFVASTQNATWLGYHSTLPKRVEPVPHWQIFKCVLSFELGLVLLTLASINPSLSLILSLISVPGLFITSPITGKLKPLKLIINMFLFCIASPWTFKLILTESTGIQLTRQNISSSLFDFDPYMQSLFMVLRESWRYYGVWTWPVLCHVYFPIVLGMFMISFMRK